MPQWQFVAFNPKAAETVLVPAQQALRSKDVDAWQSAYDKLSQFHPSAITGYAGQLYPRSKPITSWYVEVSRDQVPDENSDKLKSLLMLFLEAIAAYRVESKMSKPRVWAAIGGELAWKSIWKSEVEAEEHKLLMKEIFDLQKSVPDPFWFVQTRYISSTYVAPEGVRRLAAAEKQTNFLRRLGSGLDGELGMIGYDMARLGLVIELAALEGLALHYQE